MIPPAAAGDPIHKLQLDRDPVEGRDLASQDRRCCVSEME